MIDCCKVMRCEMAKIEDKKNEQSENLLKLQLEIQDITKRKNELSVKLSDLDSLKYVIDELEKKIISLKSEYDQ